MRLSRRWSARAQRRRLSKCTSGGGTQKKEDILPFSSREKVEWLLQAGLEHSGENNAYVVYSVSCARSRSDAPTRLSNRRGCSTPSGHGVAAVRLAAETGDKTASQAGDLTR